MDINGLRKVIREEIKKTSLNESTYDYYVVDSKTKKVHSHGSFNSSEYWRPGGKAEGTVDTIIAVNGGGATVAQKIYNALKSAGLGDSFYQITVDVK